MTNDLDPKAAEVTRALATAKASPDFPEEVPTKDLFAKATPKVRSKAKSGGLSGLLGGIPMNLTITLDEADKVRVEAKLDALSDRIEKNWRITQVIMAVAVIGGFIGQVLL